MKIYQGQRSGYAVDVTVNRRSTRASICGITVPPGLNVVMGAVVQRSLRWRYWPITWLTIKRRWKPTRPSSLP